MAVAVNKWNRERKAGGAEEKEKKKKTKEKPTRSESRSW